MASSIEEDVSALWTFSDERKGWMKAVEAGIECAIREDHGIYVFLVMQARLDLAQSRYAELGVLVGQICRARFASGSRRTSMYID